MKPVALENGKVLYGICFEYWDLRKRVWVSDIEHVHAIDRVDALAAFWQANDRKRVHISAVAPIVGFYGREVYNEVEDRKVILINA